MSKLIVTGPDGSVLRDRVLDDDMALLLHDFVENYSRSPASRFEDVRHLEIPDWVAGIRADLDQVGAVLNTESADKLKKIAGTAFAAILTAVRKARG
jgi:hypothetical protein